MSGGNVRTYQGMHPSLGEGCWVDEAAVVLGDVVLGDDSSVWPMAVVRGDVHAIRIGARTNVQDGAVVHVTHDGPYTPGGFATEIAEDVTIGHQAVIHACTIGPRCLIGIGAIVLDGAVLEAECMIGAGALVPPGKRLEGGYLYMGSPARAVRALEAEERDHLEYSAHHYVRVKDRHRGT